MYGIKYYLPDRQEAYLAIKRKNEYVISSSIKNIAEFEDEWEALDAATETAKKVYGKILEFSLLWKP